jgi:hypothetical protein
LDKKRLLLFMFIIIFNNQIFAIDASGIEITGVSDMLSNGESLLKFVAKWGGIATVVGAALALGFGKLHNNLAETIFKVLISVGLLIAAFNYFGTKISGFAF